MLTTDVATGVSGVGADPGAGGGFVDIFDNAISAAEKAFSNYNATAATPPPANTIAAVGSSIVTPVALVAGVLLLVWMFK